MTPDIKLVDDYNEFFFHEAFNGTPESLRAGLPQYITNESILHEPPSMPQGGTMVGYDGWAHLVEVAKPIYTTAEVAAVMEMTGGTYYQSGNVVFREMTMSFKATPAAPERLSIPILEKYTITDGRISEVISFEFDTAALRQRLVTIGVVPPL